MGVVVLFPSTQHLKGGFSIETLVQCIRYIMYKKYFSKYVTSQQQAT